MRFSPKTLVLGLSLLAILAACGPVAESQTLRDRLRDRAEQRAAGGGFAGRRSASLPAGAETVQITSGGRTRSFIVYAPSNLPANPSVMLILHGGQGSASMMVSQNNLRAYADREGFLAVYPEGTNKNWNDGRAKFAGYPDDVAFMRDVVNWLSANRGASRSRVFATGISNGGTMAHRLACEAPDLVAGIAPIAANFPEALYRRCSPSQATPVVMFQGTDDPLMLYQGGVPDLSNLPGRVEATEAVTSTETTISFWARVAGCGAPSSQQLPDRANDGTTVTRISYACPRDQVTLYRINGGGHSWPGTTNPMAARLERFNGPTSQDIDASALMVQFFSRYGL
jgi:polyhydroxybutyrate depolymerase